jgi:hypothetical protein
MDDTVRGIIFRGWSVDPSERDSFEVILDLLRGISFKISPVVDSERVYAFLSFAGCNWRLSRQPGEGTADFDAVLGKDRKASGTAERSRPEREPASEFGADGPRSPPDGATRLTRRIECPAFKTVMKWVFRKKPAIKKKKTSWGVEIMVPNGIIGHLTRECGERTRLPRRRCHIVKTIHGLDVGW